MRSRVLIAILVAGGASFAGGCAGDLINPYQIVMGDAELRAIPTEDLCRYRDSLLNGHLMRRELVRRGLDCAEPVETTAAAAVLPVPPRPLLLRLFDAAAVPPRPPSPAEAPPPSPPPSPPPAAGTMAAAPASAPGGSGAAVAAAPPSPPPAPAPPPPVTGRGAETAVAVAAGGGAAPLVRPGCAERILRRGEEDDATTTDAATAAEHRAVAFRNRCGFPIRVLYAARRNGSLSELTGLLRPGETSSFTGIQDGFDHPGYVVCGYERVAETAPCRLGLTASGPG